MPLFDSCSCNLDLFTDSVVATRSPTVYIANNSPLFLFGHRS
jgi:hypothetical protein